MENMSFVDNENEVVVENVNVVGDEMEGGDGLIAPEVGMQFKDEQEVYDFYARYAYAVGFPVRKRSSGRDQEGVLRYVTFTCSRQGRKNSSTSTSSKPQPTIQMGCKARISASLDIHGYWKINNVHLDHNHKTSPTKSRLYRCNRVLSAHVKRKLVVNDIAGIPLHKSFTSAVVEAGGYENLTIVEKDCRNYVEKERRLRLGEGDAAAIQSYFSEMQARSMGFYFCIDLDDESRLKNVFWADNRCRQAYKEFGDVVTFDTTYLTNKTWLKCMHGQAPRGIITDQDRAMQNAIEIVFPNTKHRWCLWHIMKKLSEKFGYHDDKKGIFSAIHVLVYDSQTVEEFEEGWREMIENFQFHENVWLSGLYENRTRWVPSFLKTFFWAGMSTTQRSESMNSFFDGYVNSKTSLKSFVVQYERALRSKVEKEIQADFKSFSQVMPYSTIYQIEKQYQSVYIISKFQEVQLELSGKVYCDLISAVEGHMETRYDVCEDVVCGEWQKRKMFVVSFNKEKCEVVCSCHLFEFRGILCRHAIAVVIRNGVNVIPDRYILRRWRKDVNRAHTRVPINYDGLVSTPSQMRYDELCHLFAEVADLAADDEGKYESLKGWIELQKVELQSTKYSCGSNKHSQGSSYQQTNTDSIKDLKAMKTKGAPRTKRRKGPLEAKSRKSKARSNKPQGQSSTPNLEHPSGPNFMSPGQS